MVSVWNHTAKARNADTLRHPPEINVLISEVTLRGANTLTQGNVPSWILRVMQLDVIAAVIVPNQTT